jgi:hypothetical protein
VPYFDEVGIEYENVFETLAAARAFRDTRRYDEKREVDLVGAPHDNVPIDGAG